MRVTLNDGRQMTGQMLAFDKHMNLVLADTEEFRKVKRKAPAKTAPGASSSGASAVTVIETEEKRTLGLTIVRGAHIVSLSVESPPPADPSARLGKSAAGGIATALQAGPGVARPAGRGAPVALAVGIHEFRWPRTRVLTYVVGSCCWRWWRSAVSISHVSWGTSWIWRSWWYVGFFS